MDLRETIRALKEFGEKLPKDLSETKMRVPAHTVMAVISGFNPELFKIAIAQNELWDRRQVAWVTKYGSKPESYPGLSAYTSVGCHVSSQGFDPAEASPIILDGKDIIGWLTVKQVLEQLAGYRIPNINPQDAIELGKVTIFQPERWYLGCTDKKDWIT